MAKWLTASLVTLVLWALWGLTGAAASRGAGAYELHAISTMGLIPIAAVFLRSRRLTEGNRLVRGCILGLISGACGNIGQIAVLAALRGGAPTALVYPLTGMYPLVTVGLAVPVLSERLNRVQIIGVALAVATIYLFSQTDSSEISLSTSLVLSPAMGLALLGLLTFGLAAFFQKMATIDISVELATVTFCASFIPFAAGIVVFDQTGLFQRIGLSGPLNWNIEGLYWGLSLLFGVLLGLGTLAQFTAFRWGKAAVVTPLTALYPPLTALLAIPILGERPSPTMLVAAVLAVCSAVALSTESEPGGVATSDNGRDD